MKRFKILLATLIMGTTIMCGCGNPDSNQISYGGAFGDNYYTYVDPETGVNYVVFSAAGYRGGICPRYNSDGSLYVTVTK